LTFFGASCFATGYTSIWGVWHNDGLYFNIHSGIWHSAFDPDWEAVPVDTWVHLAFVWDGSGIDDSDDVLRIYRDGNIVSNATGSFNVIEPRCCVGYSCTVGCSGGGYEVRVLAYHEYARLNRPAAYMDNLIIWDYAKTDFSDRFNEAPFVDANAGENLTITSEQQCDTIIEGSASDLICAPLQYRWLEGQDILQDWSLVGVNGEAYLDLCDIPLYIGQHTLKLEISNGQATSSDEMILTIDNSAPNAAPTGTGTYEIGSTITVGGQVSDFDNDLLTCTWSKGLIDYCYYEVQPPPDSLPGTPVTLPDCVLPSLELGTHIITLTVSDGINDLVSNDLDITVVDTTQPTLGPIEANKTILWPPNHQMVDIIIDTHALDNSGMPSLSAVVMSNEPQEGLGDGDMAPDWTEPVIEQDTGIITLQLRAERSGSGDGRTYTIAITATDPSYNSSTANLNIIVPHNKRK